MPALGFNDRSPAQCFGAFANAREPKMARLIRLRWVKTAAVIRDGQLRGMLVERQMNGNLSWRRVLDSVGGGFLRDPQQIFLGLVVQRRRRAAHGEIIIDTRVLQLPPAG